MKIQSSILAVALAVLCAGAFAEGKPAVDKAAAAEASRESVIKRAEGLSEDQIKQSHDIPALSKLAQVYDSQHDLERFIWVLRRITELMPNSGDLRLQLAMAYAKKDDKTGTYDTLIRMQTQGFGYDIGKDPRFESVHGTKVWDYLVANLQVNGKQFGEGKAAFELAKGDHLYDALAWDAKRGQLLVGGAREGKIQLASTGGKLTDFISADADNGLYGVDALAIDAEHHKLFVATSASSIYKGFNADNAGKSGVSEFDLASGKFLKKYAFATNDGTHRLTSLVVSKDGQVYAADGARKQVFKIDGGAMKQIVANPKLTYLSALALSADGNTLYMADFALGIFAYDLTKGQAFEPRYNQASLVLGGIVGMYTFDGTLVIVENGMVPKRVMRLQLSADGRSIEGAMPLDVAQPSFAELGAGAVAGDKLYFFTNREDALYDARGVLTQADRLEPTQVFASNLRFAWGQKGVGSAMAPLTVDDGSLLQQEAEKQKD
jgi:sugar lactone lactonase YvrE